MTLKKRLMESHVWTRLDFSQAFILDVDWSIKSVVPILSQKLEKHEQRIVPHIEAISSYGRRMLRPCLGHNALPIVFSSNVFSINNEPQTLIVAYYNFKCIWTKWEVDINATKLSF